MMEATKRQQQEYCGLVLTYRVNDTLLCVPVEHVESVIEPPAITEIPHAPDYVLGAFMHRGQTALALSLRKLLRLPTTTENNAKKESLLVIWMGEQPVGYWVDEIKGMTDSSRGHWSAVPALIRDQGITRALVCEGQVYFPLDLTHSKQFKEISRTLETYERHNLHSVSPDVVEEIAELPPLEQAPAGQPELDLAPEPPAEPESDSLLDEPSEPLEGHADTTDQDSPEEVAFLAPESPSETVDSEQALAVVDDDYIVANYPADDRIEEGYEDQIETTAFAEHEIDTTALARAMQMARFATATATPLAPIPAVQFDANGQGDAFFELIAVAEADYGPVAAPEDVSDEMSYAHFISDAQVDGFAEAYQALLTQDALYDADLVELEDEAPLEEAAFTEPQVDITALALAMQAARFAAAKPAPAPLVELQFDAHGQADALYDLIADAEAKYGPVEVPEDIGDEMHAVHFVAEGQVDGFSDRYQALLARDAIDTPDAGTLDVNTPNATVDLAYHELIADMDEAIGGDLSLPDEISLTEEPYLFIPASLPDDDEVVDDLMAEARDAELRQFEIDASFVDDASVLDEPLAEAPALDEISLTEEPYSFIPTSLPEDDFDAASEITEQPAQQNQTQALLPHLIDDTVDNNEADDVSSSKADSIDIALDLDRPVIALPHEDDTQAALPDFNDVVSKADFYADKMAQSLKELTIVPTAGGPASRREQAEARKVALRNRINKLKSHSSAEIYDFKIPQRAPEDKTPQPSPSMGENYTLPKLDSTGSIIRPDGQVNKSFGLVKVFTIILATSTAGSWWFRDELFYKEFVRKEIPSIRQNEVAFLYSNRVTIESPERGIERMVINTPDEEIKVIRHNQVSPALLRERRKKEVTIHRVKKGDTLWSIAEQYLDNPYRYEELAENSRIHDPDMIRPGDVVKITTKPTSTDK